MPLTCSGKGNSKALAEQRDRNILQLTEQAPGLWQENVAQADLSGAPFESRGGDRFWTGRIPVTFSRLSTDSPGAVQAAECWPFPSPSMHALPRGHGIHPEQTPARIPSSELSLSGALGARVEKSLRAWGVWWQSSFLLPGRWE